MSYTERSPLESGFAPIFEEKIQPQLAELEFERKAAAQRSSFRTYAIAGATALAVVLAFVFSDGEFAFGVLLLGGFLAGCAITYLRDGVTDRWTQKINAIVLPPVCAHLGDLHYKTTDEGQKMEMSLEPFRRLRLLPSHERAFQSHWITGTHAGLGFEVAQLFLIEEREGARNKEPVFRGLTIAIDLPASLPDPGRLGLLRDRGGVGNKLAEMVSFGSSRAMPKLAFPSDAAFEAVFEVYAEDPDAAGAFLTSDMRANILRLGRGEPVIGGVEERRLCLLVPRPTRFLTPGWSDKPTSEIAGMVPGLFADLAEVLVLMDLVRAGLPQQAEAEPEGPM